MSVGSSTGTKIISGIKPKSLGGKKGPGTPRTANIFGRSISASNFGAVLDISNSTHGTIDIAVKEIKDGFPDAILVLAPGCKINDKKSTKGEVVAGGKFEKDEKEYKFDGKNGGNLKYPWTFLEDLTKKNKSFERLWKDAKRDDRGYIVHLELPKSYPQNKHYMIWGTDLAMEFLIEQGCDVIYWMADFNDGINPDRAKDLAREMKRNDIKLIQHDFDGATGNDAKQRDIVKYMVEETDGEQIIGSGKK
jgi:hypothetical protein